MSSWVSLLVLLAACLRFGSAEGDPLPPALVELVRSSPISSIEDLQLLLLGDSVDEDPDSQSASGYHANGTFNRLPRSLEAQPAQQALCKVRTEVMEVTRAMLDRSNANFLLWPPCVEVQRCSGCCNTKSLQCVPIATHTRHLQVMKIQYINKRPHYDKAVVSVHDHVECRCQPAPRPPAGSKKKSSPRRQTGKDGRSAKGRTKEDLHRRDELKHNQRLQLEDLLSQHWQPRQTPSEADKFVRLLPAREQELYTKQTSQHGSPHRVHNDTRGGGARVHHRADERRRDGGSNGTAALPAAGTAKLPLDRTQHSLLRTTGEEQARMEQREGEGELETQSNGTQIPHTPLLQETNQRHRHGDNQTEESNQRREHRPSPIEETNQRHEHKRRPTEEADERHRDNDTPESERRLHTLQSERQTLEEEKQELLLLHRRLDEEKELLKQQQQKRHEEEQHPHHSQYQTYTTTQRTETTPVTSTRPPTAYAAPRPPPRPPRKKTRKNRNRNRISKAAMRAMLM